MEVVSPLAFVPPSAGSKRGLPSAYSTAATAVQQPETMDDDALLQQRSAKRRRFHNTDTSVDSLSNAFGAPSAFFQSKMSALGGPNGVHLKRHRTGSSSPSGEDLSRVVEEQAATIESLKKDNSTLESNLGKLQSDHDRVVKENHVLRNAFKITQDRQNQAEQELENAKQYKAGAEEQMKKLEQVILSLRYHLQAQQSNTAGNDFMGLSSQHRPPDVF